MTNEQQMEKSLMTLKIIWTAILASLAVYLVVGRLVVPSLPAPVDRQVYGTLRLVLYALALVTLASSRIVRKLILGARRNRASDEQSPTPAVISRYFGAVIASLAMSESVGIYGLVLYLLGKDTADFYLLLGLSAAAVIYYRPRREELDGLFQQGPSA